MANHRVARFDLGAPAVRALAVFSSVIAVLAAVLAWQARPRMEPVVDAIPTSSVEATAASMLVVSVVGKVHRPGLVQVPGGARVADAIAAAGGVLPGTDVSTVNLARKVSDGEQIVVGAPATGSAGGAPGLVNLNTATFEALQALPGVGPVLAQRIIDYRVAHGGFRSVSQLREVSGIGDAKYQELKDRVSV